MAGKSRQSKGKRVQIRKQKVSPGPAAVAAPRDPVSQPVVPVSAKSAPAPEAPVTGVRHPYVVGELRRIGILAVVILAILVVLSLVLH